MLAFQEEVSIQEEGSIQEKEALQIQLEEEALQIQLEEEEALQIQLFYQAVYLLPIQLLQLKLILPLVLDFILIG